MEVKTEYIHNDQAEYYVIASILGDPDVYEDVHERLNEGLFTDYDCRRVYKVIEDFANEGKVPNLPEVSMIVVKGGGSIDKFLIEPCHSSIIMNQYIDTLKDCQLRRELLKVCYKGIGIVNDPTAENDDIQSFVRDIENVMTGKQDNTLTYADVVTDLQRDVANRKEGATEQGMNTGLRIFDRHFGFHEGDLIIMAGETSQGKSTLATTIARNMAKGGIPSAFYSLEMSAKQMVARISAGDTQVKSSDMLYSRLTDEQYNRFYDTTTRMKNLPIFFDESSKNTMQGICRSIRRLVKKHGIRMVFIDYLQILANGGRLDSREQIIGDMARDLKRLAVELNICIVALSQLARQSEKGRSSAPSINRLRGSGQIEEAADIVVLIHRADLNSDRATIYIAKGRNIGLDKDDVKFNSMFSYFADFEQGDPQAPFKQNNGEVLPF